MVDQADFRSPALVPSHYENERFTGHSPNGSDLVVLVSKPRLEQLRKGPKLLNKFPNVLATFTLLIQPLQKRSHQKDFFYTDNNKPT